MEFTISALLVGIRRVDQGIMTYQQKYGRRIWLPIWSFLVQGNGHNILVDTGLSDFITPPVFMDETGLPEPLLMEDSLSKKGLVPEEINIVINTHLHDDHCGNNAIFSKADYFIQRKELDFCMNPHPLDYRYEPDFITSLNLKPVDGDREILPGIEILFTPGHTPGSQTVRINTAKGKVIIPGFCCNKENFPYHGPAVCPGVHCDAYLAYDTAQRVKQMEGLILPLHELGVATALARL
ncbi:MAG: N-acyl homoserine lactonase family protein [Deltaproteobacteria bacterium]|nr:N-acyl homoserine lactonase family protein [Deltaproteobacteria bacterium]